MSGAHGHGEQALLACGVQPAEGGVRAVVRNGPDVGGSARAVQGLADAVRGADGDLHGEDHRQGQPQFEPPALANQQGRDRGNPTRRQEQRREAKRGAVTPQPNRDHHRGGGGRCLRELRRRSWRYAITVPATTHPDRHPVREGGPSRRRGGQGLPPVSAAHDGTIPADMHGPLQYGNGLKAYMMNLLIAQMVPLDRVLKSVKTLIDVTISPATILKCVLRLHTALERWEASAIEELLHTPALNADETSLRVDRQNHWIHVYSGGEVTVKRLHRKRGCAAIDDIGIIPRYGGVVVHDCWASYLSYDHCGHALCGAAPICYANCSSSSTPINTPGPGT